MAATTGTITTRTIDVETVEGGSVELCLAEAGAGGRPLLVVHGFTGAKEDFVEHLPALAAEGWHAVAPDLRGHGASAAPEGEASYSLDVLAADLMGLADALGWSSLTLLGHSMGGMVVQLAVLSHPRRVDALILVDTCHGPVEIDRSLAMASVEVVRRSGTPALAVLLASLPPDANPLDTAASRQVRQARPSPLGGDDPAESWAAFGEAKLHAASPAMYAAMVPAMLDQPDRLEALGRLRLPTLVVVGEQDGAFFEPCRRMASTIPGAHLEVVRGAGHNPQHERPQEWQAAVLAFLSGLTGPPT